MIAATVTPNWVENEFSVSEALFLRRALPEALANAQRQSANAHDAFDPEGTELYVYGVGMSRADHDNLCVALSTLPSFSTKRPAGAKRDILLVDGKVILPIRVGTKMPKKVDRIRLKRVSPFRSGLLSATSMTRYESVFDMFHDEVVGDIEKELEDSEIEFLESAAAKNTLIVLYYSSTPSGIGSMYWAPATFGEKNRLQFFSPERLLLSDGGTDPVKANVPVVSPDAFAAGERPVTITKLRKQKLPAEA